MSPIKLPKRHDIGSKSRRLKIVSRLCSLDRSTSITENIIQHFMAVMRYILEVSILRVGKRSHGIRRNLIPTITLFDEEK